MKLEGSVVVKAWGIRYVKKPDIGHRFFHGLDVLLMAGLGGLRVDGGHGGKGLRRRTREKRKEERGLKERLPGRWLQILKCSFRQKHRQDSSSQLHHRKTPTDEEKRGSALVWFGLGKVGSGMSHSVENRVKQNAEKQTIDRFKST